MIEELNTRHGLDGLKFVVGENNLPKAVLRLDSGNSCEVYLYGAHLTSYRNAEFGELLYLSQKADFSDGKAIRGGIPLIFPQFGPGPLPSHGFARNRSWGVVSSKRSQDEISLVFGLASSPSIERIWPEKFSAEFEVSLGANLSTTLRVKNEGARDFAFQCALHSYFTISDINAVTVRGFENLDFLDNTKQKERGHESRKEIKIASEVDRVYLATPQNLILDDAGLGRRLIIRKQRLNDAVLWNPWIEKGASLKDLEADAYKKFVCIESGAIEPAVVLKPGAMFEGHQEILVEALR
jgi:glucose-6-phosphate 1-epimerase